MFFCCGSQTAALLLSNNYEDSVDRSTASSQSSLEDA